MHIPKPSEVVIDTGLSFDHEQILEVYNDLGFNSFQVYVTSHDGNTYQIDNEEFISGRLREDSCDVINKAFRGTYVEDVINTISQTYNICKVRFLKLNPQRRAYTYHCDISRRLHIPLITDRMCMMLIDDTVYRLTEPGKLYDVDTRLPHTALNLGNNERIHLVFALKDFIMNIEETNNMFKEPQGRAWLVGLLRNNQVDITFTKADGTERVMKCTLQEDVVVPHEKKTERVKDTNDDVLPVWDVDKGAWRSFRLDSIKQIDFKIGE